MFYHLNNYYAQSEKRDAAKIHTVDETDILFSLHEPNYYAAVQTH